MNRTQRKDFFREIKKSWNRFLSILLITTLGVAFYAGVRSTEEDMRQTVDQLYDETDFMDIRIISTLGLTEDDLSKVRSLPGVKAAETAMQTEGFCEIKQKQKIVQIFSLGEEMNQMQLAEGRLPERSGECVADTLLMGEQGFQIGDTLTIQESDALAVDTYTIVGCGSYANYLTWDRGSAGIGNGKTDGFVAVRKEDFYQDMEAAQAPIYHNIYVTVEGAKEENSYSDAYETRVDAVIDMIEAMAGEQCELRYQAVMTQGKEKLADAQTEIDEAEKKLADARNELSEAEQKLADADASLADGKDQLAHAIAEYETGTLELQEKEKELEDGEAELEQAWEVLSAGRKELEAKRAQYSAGKEALRKSKEELTVQAAELEQAKESFKTQKLELQEAEESFYAAFAEMGMTDREQIVAYVMQDATLAAQYEQMEAGKTALKTAEAEIEAGEAQLSHYLTELNEKENEMAEADAALTAGEEQIETEGSTWQDAWNRLQEGKTELEKGRMELANAWSSITEAQTELAEGEKELKQSREEYEEKRADAEKEIADGTESLADAKEELGEAREELDAIEMPEWIVLKRSNSVQNFIEYGLDAERIGAIGKVFPALFFLVATLVCLTTMTRMVEEERTQIGTMKALGYSKFAVASKYVLYALSASVIGAVLGVLGGRILFPYVIIKAYQILYINTPEPVMPLQVGLSIGSVMIAVCCTVFATILACYRELAGMPAELMRPEAPKQGKRVLLERIGFIWNHLNFTWKSSMRNLFRYKKRLFMTIFGIGGSMALLMVGFGLRDSIQTIVENQYQTLWTYDAYLSIDEDMPEEERLTYEQIITEREPEILQTLSVRQVTMDAESTKIAGTTKSVNLFVPERLDGLEDFLILKNRLSGERYTIQEGGAVISEKLARLLELSVGDTFYLVKSDTEKIPVNVTDIAENYLYHYVYLSADTYEALFDEKPVYNQLFLKLDEMSEERKTELAEKLMNGEQVKSLTYVEDLESRVAKMMRSLDMVVVVLILAAGLLAFVVLYNLNNISIMERRRELATLKVLGFYDIEVAEYVYRENVLLTFLGILMGVVLGVILHQFVIRTCEIDMIMFGRAIKPLSYLFSVILTIVFAMLVNFGMFFKLKKIDMVESLKSVE